jgi:hypothetical protein
MELNTIFDFLLFSNPIKEQEAVLKSMENFIDEKDPFDFMGLCVGLGKGKASVTPVLIGYLNSLFKPYKISTPTRRLAGILGGKAKTTTSTIHSLIYTPKSDNEKARVIFKLKIGDNQNQQFIYVLTP